MKTINTTETEGCNPRTRRVATTLILVAICLGTTMAPCAKAAGGNILPPSAQPLGWTIDDMAAAIANFSVTGNDPAYYPDTPFQIIYRHPGNAFTVAPGTFFYVKLVFIDDSPPIIGDWPADESAAANYIFGRTELGAHDLEMEVDGQVFSLDDPGYIGGPVLTPDSPDGSAHLIQMGAYLTPLAKGVHSITIRGVMDGDAMLAALSGPFSVDITYSVTVQ